MQMKCEKFVENFEEQNPGIKWGKVQNDLYATIKDTFRIASEETPPKGLGKNLQSRAMYGVDLMLRWRTAGE